MANVAGLTILLGADFTSAEQAMDAFNGKVSQFVNQMQTLFASAGVNVQHFNQQVQNISGATQAATTSINQTSSATNTLTTNTARLSGGFNSLGYTSTRVFHGLAELMVRPGQALLILSNDIPQLITRLNEARSAGQSFGSALIAALDPMVIAIQIGITALIRYAPELYRWATGADEAAKKAKELADEQKQLASIDQDGQKNFVASADKLQLLVNIMGDSTVAMKSRISAMKEAKKEYPELLKNYSDEDLLNKNFAKTLQDTLIPQLKAAALMKAALAKSDFFSNKELDNSVKAADYLTQYKIAVKELDDYRKQHPNAIAGATSAFGNAGTGASAGDIRLGQLIEKVQTLSKAYYDAGGEALFASNAQTQFLKIAQDQALKAGDVAFGEKGDKGSRESRKKTGEQIAQDIFDGAQTAIRKANLDLQVGRINPTQFNMQVDGILDGAIAKIEKLNAANKFDLISNLRVQFPTNFVNLTGLKGTANDEMGGYFKGLEYNKKHAEDFFNEQDEAINKSMANRAKQNKESLAKMNSDFKDEVQHWDSLISQPIHTFYSDLLQGKNVFKDLAKSFEEMIANMLAKATEASLMEAILGKDWDNKMGGSNVFQYMFGGGRGVNGKDSNPIKTTTPGGDTPANPLYVSVVNTQSDADKPQTGDSTSVSSLLGGDASWLFSPDNGINYGNDNTPGKGNFDASKAIGDAAMASLSLLDSATINNTTTNNIDGTEIGKSSEANTALGVTGSIISMIPGLNIVGGAIGLISKLHLFADGGIVTGPTLGMIGEAGKEAVIPLDKLNQFTKSADSLTVNVKGVATGRDLAIVGNNYNTYKTR